MNDCANLGVETGTFQAWQASYGTWSADLGTNTATVLSEANGFQPLQHRIRHVSEGNVPEVTGDAIPFVPPGSEYAIQLGNSIKGAEFERLTTSFLVDSFNTLFQYQFAVIFEDPGHPPIQQPKFELLVTDHLGQTLPCGYYEVKAAGQIEGFKNEGNVRYRNWTTAGIDLRDYIGQVVTLQISTYDCSKGGHWGMALFDASCLSSSIKAVNYCPGFDSVLTLEAPLGFQNYVWSNGAVGRIATMPNPQGGATYSVEFTPYSSLADSCRLSLAYTVPTGLDVLPKSAVSFCENGGVTIGSDLGDAFDFLWQPGGDTTAFVQVSTPGLYTVQASKPGGCVLHDTVAVTSIPAPQVVLDYHHPACNGKNDGFVEASVTSGEPVSYWWSAVQDTASAIYNLPSGAYEVVVTGLQTGCSTTAMQVLQQVDSVTVAAQLMRLPLCDNWPEGGEAIVTAAAGNPPYTYAWSTGSQQPKTKLLTGGMFRVTVTDADGCAAVDSFRVNPLRATAETEGNVCHDGNKGVIEIDAIGGSEPYRYALDNGLFDALAKFTGLATGAYTYQVQDGNGCIRNFETEVKNLRAQPFTVQLPADTTITVGDYMDIALQYNYPLQAVTWSSSCAALPPLPVVTLRPMERCQVSVEAIDSAGCVAQAEMTIKVLKKYNLYVPNVFMPSGDLDNSHFYASVSPNQIKEVHSFRVFDRWGSIVFQDFHYHLNEVEEGWDGMVEGQKAPPGVYAYLLDVEFIDGVRQVLAGDVTLVR